MAGGYEVTLDDWLDILELRGTVASLKTGQITVATALDAVDYRRGIWPNVHADYVLVLDALAQWMIELRTIIEKQNEKLREIAAQISMMVRSLPADMRPSPLPVPNDRLLNEEERQRIARLPDELAEIEGLLESWAEYLEQIAWELTDLAEQAGADEDE